MEAVGICNEGRNVNGGSEVFFASEGMIKQASSFSEVAGIGAVSGVEVTSESPIWK